MIPFLLPDAPTAATKAVDQTDAASVQGGVTFAEFLDEPIVVATEGDTDIVDIPAENDKAESDDTSGEPGELDAFIALMQAPLRREPTARLDAARIPQGAADAVPMKSMPDTKIEMAVAPAADQPKSAQTVMEGRFFAGVSTSTPVAPHATSVPMEVVAMRAKLGAGDGVESPKNMPPMVAVKPDASDGQDAKLLTSAPQQILESDRKPVQVAAPQRPEMAAKPVGTAQPETRLASVQGEPADIAPLAAVAPERAAQTHLPPPPTQMPAQHVETARHVANQMAIAMTDRAGRATEISLNPEELGRVRLTMSAVDTAITLSISAERQETSDLLRRHIETLAQEFRDLGYDDITFSFGQRDNPQQGTADPSPSGREQPAEDDDLGMLRPTKIASASGLDIKV